MAVTRSTLRLLAEQKRELLALLTASTDDIVAAWVRAWDETATDLQRVLERIAADPGTARVSLRIRERRGREALALVSRRLDEALAVSGVQASAAARALITQAVVNQPQLIFDQLPPGYAATMRSVDAGQVERIVARSTEQITARTRHLGVEATESMRRELLHGLVAGDNPKVTARRMVARTRSVFDGGMARALVIARTETLDAYRAAAAATHEANADVLSGWQWIATLSTRTCPSCIAQHGTKHPLSEPGPHDHHCGRCSRLPVTKTWAELGFPGIAEPPSAVLDARVWFDGLSVADQRQVLGPARFGAWREGRYPIGSWSVRRSTPGWRDAWHTSPVPVSR